MFETVPIWERAHAIVVGFEEITYKVVSLGVGVQRHFELSVVVVADCTPAATGAGSTQALPRNPMV